MKKSSSRSEKKRLVIGVIVLILISIFIVAGPMYILHMQRVERAKRVNEKKSDLLESQMKINLNLLKQDELEGDL